MGGFLGQFGPLLPTGNIVKNVNGMYRLPLIEVVCPMRDVFDIDKRRST